MVLACQNAGKDGIANASSRIDMVQGRVKAMVFFLSLCNVQRIFVGDPPGVDAVHVNPILHVINSRGSCEHVQRGLGHVGMRMRVPFEGSVKHSLHGRYVHDVFVSMRTAKHEWFQSGIQNKRRH